MTYTEAQRRHYQENKEVYKARSNAGRKKRRQQWLDFMDDKSCCKCGATTGLQWHHIPGEVKLANVGDLIGRRGWDIIMEEVKKCDCVCYTCHMEHHYGGV